MRLSLVILQKTMSGWVPGVEVISITNGIAKLGAEKEIAHLEDFEHAGKEPNMLNK